MTVTSTCHGLRICIRTDDDIGSDTTDNRRLRRLVPDTTLIDNTYNNATSGRCQMQRFCHEGFDFSAEVGSKVSAMYGSMVVKVVNQWRQASTREQPLNNHVTVPLLHGFRHRCQLRAHPCALQSTEGSLKGAPWPRATESECLAPLSPICTCTSRPLDRTAQ